MKLFSQLDIVFPVTSMKRQGILKRICQLLVLKKIPYDTNATSTDETMETMENR